MTPQQQFLDRRARLGFGRPAARPIMLPPPVEVPVEVVVEAPPKAPVQPTQIARQRYWRAIVADVAEKHGLGVLDLLGPSRRYPIVIARNEAFYRLRTEITVLGKPMSYPQIGKRFHKDHSTIIHGFKAHQASFEANAVKPNIEKKGVAAQDSWCSMEDRHSNPEAVE